MPIRPLLRSRALTAATVCLFVACDGGGTAPVEEARLEFSAPSVQLVYRRQAEIELRNEGGRPVGPVTLSSGPVETLGGGTVGDARLVVEPSRIATVTPESPVRLRLRLDLPSVLPARGYVTELRLRSDLGEMIVPVHFAVQEAGEEDVASLSFVQVPRTVRQGDPARLELSVRDAEGLRLEAAPIRWSTLPAGAAHVAGDRFVALDHGSFQLVARAGELADTASVSVEPRGLSGSMSVHGSWAAPDRNTSDLWVRGDVAYTGTWLGRGPAPRAGNALFAWDVTNPTRPLLADSVVVDARVVNDVKVARDRDLALLTHEGSNDGKNGVTFLDVSDPLHPEPVGRFTEGLESGVHNAWLEGDYAYVVVDGLGNGLRILDVADPTAPRLVGAFYAGRSFLHDVYVRDGLAFLSHWNAGLVILDVGNGIAGGSPERPVEASRLTALEGETHNAWYWPEAGYVFVGEEDFVSDGVLHVVDVRDLEDPRQVATFEVPGDTPHNFWLDEAAEILYMAWYSRGIRAVDVSGELLGPLERQGREIASLVYGLESGSCPPAIRRPQATCTWAPQVHDGRLYLSDIGAGLVVGTPVR